MKAHSNPVAITQDPAETCVRLSGSGGGGILLPPEAIPSPPTSPYTKGTDMTIRTYARSTKEERSINEALIRYIEELLAPEKPKKAQPARQTRKAA